MGDNMTAASAVMMYPGEYEGPLLEGVFQPMPELTGDEYEALKADVKARGIVTPVMVDQHGRVLDGHHRLKVAGELGIVCPLIVHPVADDAEAWGLALAVNAARRQLNREQRRELIRRELVRCPADSDRAIARRVGCSPSTVGAIRNPDRGVSKLDSEPVMTRAEAEERTAQIRAAVVAVHDALAWSALELLSNGVAVSRIVAALEARRAILDHETPAEIGQVAGLLIDPVIGWIQAPETVEDLRPQFEGPEFLPLTESETQEALELLAGGAL